MQTKASAPTAHATLVFASGESFTSTGSGAWEAAIERMMEYADGTDLDSDILGICEVATDNSSRFHGVNELEAIIAESAEQERTERTYFHETFQRFAER